MCKTNSACQCSPCLCSPCKCMPHKNNNYQSNNRPQGYHLNEPYVSFTSCGPCLDAPNLVPASRYSLGQSVLNKAVHKYPWYARHSPVSMLNYVSNGDYAGKVRSSQK